MSVCANILESPRVSRWADDLIREDWEQGAAIKCDPVIIGRITIDEPTRQLLSEAFEPIWIGGIGTRWKADASIRGEMPAVERFRIENNRLVSPKVLDVIDECTDVFTDITLADIEGMGIRPKSALETFVRGSRKRYHPTTERPHIDTSRRGSSVRELRYAVAVLGPATVLWSGTLEPSQVDHVKRVTQFDGLVPFACETGDVIRFHELLPHAEPDNVGISRLFMTSTMEYAW